MSDANTNQSMALFVTESKVISDINLIRFNNKLRDAISQGYIQFGAPFVWGSELAVNVVKIDQCIADLTKKVLEIGLAQLTDLGI